jgi:hypothetical protein
MTGKKGGSSGSKRHPLSDEWIATHTYLAPEKLHALGVITVLWNACETHLLVLFMMVAQLQPHTAWIIAHDLGDASLSERIRELAKARNEAGSLAEDAILAINRLLKVYDVCRQNRNALTHLRWKSMEMVRESSFA